MKNGYIINEYECLINVKRPENYSKSPTNWIVLDGHHMMLIDDIKKYQMGILCDYRITMINGINLSIEHYTDDDYYCDSCNAYSENKYHYCYDCQHYLCELCFNVSREMIIIIII